MNAHDGIGATVDTRAQTRAWLTRWIAVAAIAGNIVLMPGAAVVAADQTATGRTSASTHQASRTACSGYVFRNTSAAYGAGHVAFGFVGYRGGVAWGSVNGFEGVIEKTFVAVESDNERVMIADMRRRGYDDYVLKTLPSRSCDYDAAITSALDVTSGWYVLTVTDCANATHDVLRALGFGESDLGSDWFWRIDNLRPNVWFNQLRNERGWTYRRL